MKNSRAAVMLALVLLSSVSVVSAKGKAVYTYCSVDPNIGTHTVYVSRLIQTDEDGFGGYFNVKDLKAEVATRLSSNHRDDIMGQWETAVKAHQPRIDERGAACTVALDEETIEQDYEKLKGRYKTIIKQDFEAWKPTDMYGKPVKKIQPFRN